MTVTVHVPAAEPVTVTPVAVGMESEQLPGDPAVVV